MRRIVRHFATFALALMMLGGVAFAQTAKYGGPVNVLTVTEIKDLHATPEKFVGKTIRVDGVVSSVCTEMGCWAAVTDTVTNQTVRFQAEHDGSIVFPLTAKGRGGSFQGEFVKIGANDKEAHEAAAEHAHADPKAADFGSRYQIKVTGWVSGPLK